MITWERSKTAAGGRDYASADGRWYVINPKSSPAKRWELWDYSNGTEWCGEWPTLTAAKARAEQLEKIRS